MANVEFRGPPSPKEEAVRAPKAEKTGGGTRPLRFRVTPSLYSLNVEFGILNSSFGLPLALARRNSVGPTGS
jgi:hypothetical protein